MITRSSTLKIAVTLITLFFIIVLGPLAFGTRSLTENEIDILSPIYESSVSLDEIRIKTGGTLTLVYPGVTVMNTISFPKDAYDEHDESDRALLVHEVCHVWQYQNFGLGYIPRSLWETVSQSDTYTVHYDKSKELRDYDVEEQCEIMSEFYLTGRSEFETYVEQLDVK